MYGDCIIIMLELCFTLYDRYNRRKGPYVIIDQTAGSRYKELLLQIRGGKCEEKDDHTKDHSFSEGMVHN